eukprot:1932880-Rhodomonas_salina.1
MDERFVLNELVTRRAGLRRLQLGSAASEGNRVEEGQCSPSRLVTCPLNQPPWYPPTDHHPPLPSLHPVEIAGALEGAQQTLLLPAPDTETVPY